jgi:hypothetical protein
VVAQLEGVIISTMADGIMDTPELFGGKKILANPPFSPNGTAKAPIFPLWKWTEWCKRVLLSTPEPTTIFLVVPARADCTDLTMAFGLDRRVFTMVLRKWIEKVYVSNGVKFWAYEESTGHIQETPLPHPDLVMVIVLRSTVSFPKIEHVVVTNDEQCDDTVDAGPQEEVLHIRLDLPASSAESPQVLLRILNSLPADCATEDLYNLANPSYDPCDLPLPTRGCPEDQLVCDWLAGPETVERLVEDAELLELLNVNWGVVHNKF